MEEGRAIDDSPAARAGFKRARTEEQKRERMAAILHAADQLLDEHAYRSITMAMVAARLGFSRANLVHYVATKEEIFLRLYVQDIEGLAADLAAFAEERLSKAEDPSPGPRGISADDEAFARFFAAACARRRNFGRIGALLTTIIETNVDIEVLAACKRRIYAAAGAAAEQLARLFPFLASDDAQELIMAASHYVAGLYPAAHPTPAQVTALLCSGSNGAQQAFEPTLERFVIVQLAGYRALHRP